MRRNPQVLTFAFTSIFRNLVTILELGDDLTTVAGLDGLLLGEVVVLPLVKMIFRHFRKSLKLW